MNTLALDPEGINGMLVLMITAVKSSALFSEDILHLFKN